MASASPIPLPEAAPAIPATAPISPLNTSAAAPDDNSQGGAQHATASHGHGNASGAVVGNCYAESGQRRSEDTAWMRHAIALALRARGMTHPNPLVGAVIVKDGKLIGEGWHARDGGPHAEVAALSNLEAHSSKGAAAGNAPDTSLNTTHTAGNTSGATGNASSAITPARPAEMLKAGAAHGATLYVTLEPCSTHGRTGACTDAIIRAGISRVVIGAIDPCPAHAGNAIPVLQKAGIAVSHGLLAEECTDLNLIFNHRIVSAQPFIAAKVAVTLDGKIATRAHDSRWITGPAARADVMLWRRYFPAIGVGAGTILADNPSLTARPAQPAEPVFCSRRLVFDRSGKTAAFPEANVFTDAFASHTLVITAEGEAAQKLEPLRKAGIAIAALPASAFLPEHFASALRSLLLQEQLTGLYIEGGGGLLSDLLAARALDYLFSYRAPKLLADAKAVSPFNGQHTDRMANAFTLRNVRHASFGEDQLMRGHIVYPQGA